MSALRLTLTLAGGFLALSASLAGAAVDVSAPPAQVKAFAGGIHTIQTVTLANEVNSYTLVYDFNVSPDKPGEATSDWWGWTAGYIPIGMTAPSQANWYWQAFFNWYFDEEDLSKRPAAFRVVRGGGPDGLVEYAWDTPKVRAWVRFGLATGSDKLLMFGRYEPKVPVQRSYLRLSCYPATFERPHNRAVTTASGTWRPGQTVNLDLSKDRWVLYEDTTPDRPANGSGGLLIGTPQAFSAVTIPVGEYGITTTIELQPEARNFALGLYEFPSLPDYEATRDYFRQTADKEARLLESLPDPEGEPLPAMPVLPARRAALMDKHRHLFERPAEYWRPDPEPLAFPWARSLPGGPLKTVLFCSRWRAWETMELARRLDLQVEHIYFDGDKGLSLPEYWPYAGTTGIGAIPMGVAVQRAVELASRGDTQLFLCAGITGAAIPSIARALLLEQVKAGKGLLIANPPGRLEGWPQEIFQSPEPGAAEEILAGMAWDKVPGYREGEGGRLGEGLPVEVYRYGQGRVVVLRINTRSYSALVPVNSAAEGLAGAMDRCLALCARAVLRAANRAPTVQINLRTDQAERGELRLSLNPPASAGSTLVVRVQDDLDRVLLLSKLPLPVERLALPPLPAGRAHFADALVQDRSGACLGWGFAWIPPLSGPSLEEIRLAPVWQPAGTLIPRVELPTGGRLQCSVRVGDLPRAARLTWEVSDVFGRLLVREETPVAAGGGSVEVALSLPRPVTVCHQLDLTLSDGGRALAHARQRFAVALPYPYDDFTGLMWSYAGAEPVLQRTDRLCYEWGADMMDLCHMGGYKDEAAAREYWLSARSGLRLVPYVTWLGGTADENHVRVPCLHDPNYRQSTWDSLVGTCRQSAPFSPAAYTLGDENRLNYGRGDCCSGPHSVAAFRKWLKERYGSIEELNRVWDTDYRDFSEIQPMLLPEAAKRTTSFASWIEHKLFMDGAFAEAHEYFAEAVRSADPGAKVGWDGITSQGWESGCDFFRLTQNLELNQTYISDWLSSELVRSFKRRDALTGKWGNGVADVEEGWHAFPWDCLLAGDNSVWWWTSWGCDYVPFNPDLSQSNFGKWFFEALRETTSGPGKLLLHARRETSPVGVLYSPADMFASVLQAEMVPGMPLAGDSAWRQEQEGLLRGLRDYGCQYRHVHADMLEKQGLSPAELRVFFLPLAVCLSDRQVAVLRRYVEEGGTLVVDGRAGLLTGEGKLRDSRPLAEVLGVRAAAGLTGLQAAPVTQEIALRGTLSGVAAAANLSLETFSAQVLEPGLEPTTGRSLAAEGKTPVVIVNRFGKGCAITLNLGLSALNEDRRKPAASPLERILAAVLESAGVEPFCELRGADGERPRCVQQVLFTDGRLRYLAFAQDILVRGLPPQAAHVGLPEAAFVYDLRAGKALGRISEWDVTIARGWPLVYALLPYEVTGLAAEAPDSTTPGSTAEVRVRVRVSDNRPGYHVVRMDVYAPGATKPHRQYSQNIACPSGRGQATIPFALNDARGEWRLELRDVATGVSLRRSLRLG